MSKKIEPNGISLLKTLVDLLADQHGVKITYELTENHEKEKGK
jgi:hypothetical protein